MVSAAALQYAQRPPSRAKIARRDRPTWVRYGTRTYRESRITSGTGSACRALCSTPSPSATQTALPDRMRMAARRTDTTHSGSYVWLSTKAVELTVCRMSGIVVTLLRQPGNIRAPIVPDRLPDCTHKWRPRSEAWLTRWEDVRFGTIRPGHWGTNWEIV